MATAVAPDDSVLVVGLFRGEMAVGGTTLISQGDADAFVLKLDPTGAPVWSRSLGSAGPDGALAVGVDGQGEIYVSGVFSGTFDPGTGPLTATGSSAGFLVRMSPQGQAVWGKALQETTPRALAVSAAGEITVAGSLFQTTDLGGGPLAVEGETDAVVALYDREGKHVRSARYGGNGGEDALGIARGNQGDLWLVGTYEIAFDPGTGALPQPTEGADDLWLMHLSPGGEILGARGFGSAKLDFSTGVAVGPQGEVVVSMILEGPSIDLGTGLLTNHGFFDAAVVKLDASGQPVWAKTLGGTGVDGAFNVAVGNEGEIYLSGSYGKGLDLGTGSLQPSAFISNITYRLDPDGTPRWWSDLGGADVSAQALYGGLGLVPSGGVISVGRFSKKLGEIPSQGKGDVFVARFAP